MTRKFSDGAVKAADPETRARLPEKPGRPMSAGPDPLKAAIYSRYSTMMQTEVSIERQEEICEAYAASTGRAVVHKFKDIARSGAYIAGRDGLEALMEAARSGKFGVLVIENVDRLSRDLGNASTLYKQLLNMGVEIHQPGRGRLTLTDVALQGLMGDEGRRLLAERAQYARNVMAQEGRVPTGRCFGYLPVPGHPGHVAVHEPEAEVVRRAYALRLEGMGVKAICSLLYAEGVRYPRSGGISHFGINHMLANERYAGLIVYRRHEARKDRETGKRRVSQRPRSQWIVTEAPHLRIVDQDTWDRVQAMRKRGASHVRTGPAERASSYLLTGLIPCPACNRPMSASRNSGIKRLYVCQGATRDGTCSHKRGVPVAALEALVMRALGEHLDRPGFVEAYAAAYNEERERAESQYAGTRASLQRKVDDVQRKLIATFDTALTEGLRAGSIAALRSKLEGELQRAEDALAEMPRLPPVAVVDRGRIAGIRDAANALADQAPFRPRDGAGRRMAAAIRSVIQRIDVANTGFAEFEATVTLRVSPFLDLDIGAEPAGDAYVIKARHEKTTRGYTATERCRLDWERQARGDFSITDADWEAVEDLLPAIDFNRGRRPPRVRRAAVDGLVFLASTGATFSGLPPSLGGMFTARFCRVLRQFGYWAPIAGRLAARDPVRYGILVERPFKELPPPASSRRTRRAANGV